MVAQKANYAIMFADVSGSSKLYKDLGNDAAKAAIDKLIQMMISVTVQQGGKVVKTIGDEVMSCFPTAPEALKAARAMQYEVHLADSSPALKLRIGIDLGEVLIENQDLFGNAVNNAAYVSHVARGDQVVLTQNVLDGVEGEIRRSCTEFDRIVLKGDALNGNRHKVSVYLLNWEELVQTKNRDVTHRAELPDITRRLGGQLLRLEYQNQCVEVSAMNTPYSIGRSQTQVSLIIASSLASREHCEICYRRGKFVLLDHSTNGTYVTQAEGREIYLRREELPLTGSGVISFGEEAAVSEQDLLTFSVG